MSSLIEGYNYDIFISYRQKDNKHDGWVTEFVNNLKGELESTFKEEISVYFDINPHDGLLETHDVDASLKEKLKCLIFIPIISRTYCDPKSFAWEHEFKAFVEMASKDQFGLKVKLPNGNVASRVLPIRIHELDRTDIKDFETVLGSVLRGIEFIYKETGLDKPLSPQDNENQNLNKTKYRLQVIKVAQAIKEIIYGIKKLDKGVSGNSKQEMYPHPENEGGKQFNATDVLEKSVAVLPFKNDSPDEENTYFINGLMDEILNNLQKIRDLRVISRTSTEQYRDKPKALSEIARELGVNYIVEGSGQKYGKSFRLRVQLLLAPKERHLWGESYQHDINDIQDIYRVQSRVAESVAKKLKAVITPIEKSLIQKIPLTNPDSYDAYLKGQYHGRKLNPDDLNKALDYYNLSIELYPQSPLGYTGLCNVWLIRAHMGYASPYEACMKAVDNAMKALKIDPELIEIHYSLALINLVWKWNWDEAETELKKVLKLNPNHADAHAFYSQLLCRLGLLKESIREIEMAIKLDPVNPMLRTLFCAVLVSARRFDEVIEKATELKSTDPLNVGIYWVLTYSFHMTGRFDDALENWMKGAELYHNKEILKAFNDGKSEGGYKAAMHKAGDYLALNSESEYINEIEIAFNYLMAEDKKLALYWTKKAFEKRNPNLIPNHPLFDIVRDSIEFHAIANKINLPYSMTETALN